MDTKRIKTVIILLLLAVDILLLALMGVRAGETETIRQDSATAAVSALAALGISTDIDIILNQPAPIYAMEEERSVELELQGFGAIIGAEPDDFTEIGSGVYHAETETGILRISNSGLFDMTYKWHSKESDEAFFALITTLDVIDNTQHINGSPVFNRGASYNTDVAGITGGLLLGEVYTVSNKPSKSVEAALLSLAGTLTRFQTAEPLGSVVSCELGYTAELAARGYTSLRPIWRIELTSGLWYVDAVTLNITETG